MFKHPLLKKFPQPASLPIAILSLELRANPIAQRPIAILLDPVQFRYKERLPIEILLLP